MFDDLRWWGCAWKSGPTPNVNLQDGHEQTENRLGGMRRLHHPLRPGPKLLSDLQAPRSTRASA